jgi:hypothetical protein
VGNLLDCKHVGSFDGYFCKSVLHLKQSLEHFERSFVLRQFSMRAYRSRTSYFRVSSSNKKYQLLLIRRILYKQGLLFHLSLCFFCVKMFDFTVDGTRTAFLRHLTCSLHAHEQRGKTLQLNEYAFAF